MVTQIIRLVCPTCCREVMVVSKSGEPYLCPGCLHFFRSTVPAAVPLWVWGVLAVLSASLIVAR